MRNNYTAAFLSLCLFLLLCQGCGQEEKALDEQKLQHFVNAYTEGMIVRNQNLEVHFNQAVKAKDVAIGQALPKNHFQIKPAVSGSAKWKGNNILVFEPDDFWPANQVFEVKLNLNTFFEQEEEAIFKTKVETPPVRADVRLNPYKPYENEYLEWNFVELEAHFSTLMKPEEVESLFKAKYAGRKHQVRFLRMEDNRKGYFSIDSIQRTEVERELSVFWNLSDFSQSGQEEANLLIPSINSFEFLEMDVLTSEVVAVRLAFSDPLKAQSSLKDLVKVNGKTPEDFEILGNQLRIFVEYKQKDVQLYISPDLQSSAGAALGKKHELTAHLNPPKPEIAFLDGGNIIPEQNTPLFFKAIHLKAVDVKIIKVYADNVGSFMQINELGGSRELRRVGKLVAKKTLMLHKKGGNTSGWNTYQLDLSALAVQEPGAIYRVVMSARPHYATYQCPNQTPKSISPKDWEITDSDWAYWSQADYFYYSDDYDLNFPYNWQEQENPCHEAYYRNLIAAKNILYSNVGITAKKTADAYRFFISELTAAKPLKGAEVTLYDLQLQAIGSGQTDHKGMLDLPLEKQAFFAVAQKGNEINYLKLKSSQALDVSSFDINGVAVSNGLKAFLYTERGVRRPGDSVFVGLMLEQQSGSLPKDLPVKATWADPKGRSVQTLRPDSRTTGHYAFRFGTENGDLTGNWQLKLEVGNQVFYQYFPIESIRPNRLRAELAFEEEPLKRGKWPIELTAEWLHGAPASGLKAEVSYRLTARKASFKGFETYEFEDVSKTFDRDEVTVFEAPLDANGQADFTHEFEAGDAFSSMLTARFKTRIFETGGDVSTLMQQKEISPYGAYIGMRFHGHQDRSWSDVPMVSAASDVELVSVDAEGNKQKNAEAVIQLFKIDWSWWWSADPNRLNRFVSNRYQFLKKEHQVKLADGQGKVPMEKVLSGQTYGYYFVKVSLKGKEPHSCGKIIYLRPEDREELLENRDFAHILSIESDKSTYQVKEEARISFPSDEGGSALVSIEKNNQIVQTFLQPTDAQVTTIDLPILKEWTPNVYVHISYLQPHQKRQNDLPIRMFGLIPIEVVDQDNQLVFEVEAPDVLRPEEKAALEVKAEQADMTYTLALVDEGLLNLTQFKTPAPYRHFFAKEALQVKTWDMFDQVVGAYAGAIEPPFEIGGDGSVDVSPEGEVKRFKPIVRFLGPFELKKGKTATHEVPIPYYVGSLRLMVVAKAKEEKAYGHYEKDIPVRSPLMVLANFPRILTAGDQVALPVNVFATEDKVKKAAISLSTNAAFEVIGPKKKEVNFDQIGEKTIYFEVVVKEGKVGKGQIQIEAVSGKTTAKDEMDIPLRYPNRPERRSKSIHLPKGESVKVTHDFFGILATQSLAMSVSSAVSLNLERHLDYLIRYPHGCLEQTVSAAFPQLYLSRLSELSNTQLQNSQTFLREAIAKMPGFQLSDGGMGFWQQSGSASQWGSIYAAHFLLEASEQAYPVSSELKKNLLDHLALQAKNHNQASGDEALIQAYRLYVLALARQTALSEMNRMRGGEIKDPAATALLAAAYAEAGRMEAAQSLWPPKQGTPYTSPNAQRTFRSTLRDLSIQLLAAKAVNDQERGFLLARDIGSELSSGNWHSTQTRAFALLALGNFVGKDFDAQIDFSYRQDDGAAPIRVSASRLSHTLKVSTGSTWVEVENKGQTDLFIHHLITAIPEAGAETSFSKEIDLRISYEDYQNRSLNVDEIPKGTDFRAVVKVKHMGARRDFKDLALTQLFPGCWEIRNRRLEGESLPEGINYRDIRDDRVMTYFDLKQGEEVTFTVDLHAAYAGTFYLPAQLVEDMYDHSVGAQIKGQSIECVEKK